VSIGSIGCHGDGRFDQVSAIPDEGQLLMFVDLEAPWISLLD
jgi:hypothetical protein